MGMVTYDGLNGASAQSCKTDRLTVWKVPCLSRQRMHNGIFFLIYDGGGIKYICLEDADTIGLSIFFCLQQKKYVEKKPKKKQKLDWNTEARNRTMPFAWGQVS